MQRIIDFRMVSQSNPKFEWKRYHEIFWRKQSELMLSQLSMNFHGNSNGQASPLSSPSWSTRFRQNRGVRFGNGGRLVDFNVTNTAGRKAIYTHGWAVVRSLLVDRDERVVAIALDATRFATAVSENLTHIIDVATDIDDDTLRELGRLYNNPPLPESILCQSWLNESQFRIASRFFLISSPRPRGWSFNLCAVLCQCRCCWWAALAERRVVLRYFGIHKPHCLVADGSMHHVVDDIPAIYSKYIALKISLPIHSVFVILIPHSTSPMSKTEISCAT